MPGRLTRMGGFPTEPKSLVVQRSRNMLVVDLDVGPAADGKEHRDNEH